MRRFEREVVDYKLIEAMLQEMNIINVGMNDEDVRQELHSRGKKHHM